MNKKTMLAISALCATVAIQAKATDTLVSSDVVGYQTKETVSGFNFFTPTFKQVGTVGKTFNINDVVLDPSTATSWGDNIQILDEGGSTVSTYYWVGAGELVETACWTEDFGTAVDIDFTSGMSFIIDTQVPVKVTVAGEVLKGNITATTVAGFNFIGNSSPSPLDIQSITLSGDNTTSWGDNIQILDEGGSTISTYYWVAAGELVENACWTEDFGTAVEYSIDAGLGFILDTQNSDVDVTIPMAL